MCCFDSLTLSALVYNKIKGIYIYMSGFMKTVLKSSNPITPYFTLISLNSKATSKP